MATQSSSPSPVFSIYSPNKTEHKGLINFVNPCAVCTTIIAEKHALEGLPLMEKPHGRAERDNILSKLYNQVPEILPLE